MQQVPADPHAGHRMPVKDADPITAQAVGPAEASAGPAHAADTIFGPDVMEPSREAAQGELTGHIVMVDRLEWQAGDGEDSLAWDFNAWTGDDIDRVGIKSEGEIAQSGMLEEAEIQALWSHAISPWFDLETGVRFDIRDGPERAHLALGVQGLTPYLFEVDAAVFLSHKGDVTGRIEAEYDQRITQRLIAQPRIELELSAQDVPELGLGSGFTSLNAGLRLRYEIAREFAPYIGVEWQRDLGKTADWVRVSGDDPDRIVFVFGLRAWF
ncbi:MAG: copper resistance protein B [Novosphingobium sp.]|nr:copper resistance protein B [Novosphingobium sp.]